VLEQVHLHQKVQVLMTLSLGLVYQEVFALWSETIEVFFIKDSLGEVEYNIPLCVANKSIAIILIPNKYHEFRAWCKFVCTNFIGEVHICSTWRCNILGFSPVKIS